MRTIATVLTVLVLGVSTALAQPAASPTSPPQATVLFIPLKQLSDSGGHAWVAEAIEENLVSEVAQAGDLAKKLDASAATTDMTTALKDAHDAGANIVIYGSYQVVDDQIRVTAHAVDVASGRVVAPLGTTGNLRDLFKMEDALADMLRPALPRTAAATTPQIIYGTPNTNPYSAVANPNDQSAGMVPNPPADNQVYPDGYPVAGVPYSSGDYYYPNYNYYAYPYYGYPYYSSYYPYYGYYGPAFYGGIYFGRGWGYGYHSHFVGGGFRGGFGGGFRGGFRGGGGHGR
jgi:TolB-like protein